MALKAPVEYWKAKRNGHRKSIILISIASVTVLVAGLWSLSIAPVDEIANRLFADDLLPHGKLVIFGFVATLLVWLLRILVRILFAQIKQAGDAEQRSVMTQTYLALLEASNISHEEKLLVFAAIFSPTDASAISDVNHPVTPLEVVGSLAQRLTK